MERKHRLHRRMLYALLGVVLVCVVYLQTGVARGEVGNVTGMDQYYGTGDVPATIDVLSVTGAQNDTVFMEVKKGNAVIASHLAFTLGANTAEEQGGQYVGVASVTINDFDPASTYTIAVFSDREQTKELYSGTVTPVYAQLEGVAKPQLIALRTLGKENREFNVPKTVSFGGASYELVSESPASTSPVTYEYKAANNKDAVNGTITYIDDAGNVLKTESVEGIAYGSTQKVEIPKVLTVGQGSQSAWWRTVNFGGSVTLAYPGTTEYTIPCKPLANSNNVGNAANLYFAKINLVDENGTLLASDSLNVTSKYNYTAPARLHLTGSNGVVTTYELSKSNDALNSSGILTLDPSTDGVTDGIKTYNIVYTALASDAKATWTVVTVNGAADPKASNRTISSQTFEVEPGKTATFEPKKTLEFEGKTYVPTASTKDSYEFTYGKSSEAVTYIYYVPDDYVAPEPYDITVSYVNIADGSVLQTKTLTSRPELRDELEITSPETFTQDGEEYVRLAGQEQSIWHSFYSSNRAYRIYYRNVNDVANAGVTITRVNVEYVDGGTTVTDNGTINAGTTDNGTTTGTGGTTDVGTTDGGATGEATGANGATGANDANGGATVEDGTATAAIPAVDGLTVVNGNDNDSASIVDGEGRDTNTMRIEDDETPLASLSGDKNASSLISNPVVAIGIAAAIAAALLLLFVVRKRRNQQTQDGE